MSQFCISLILTYNHFPVEKINHSFELIGVVIIMLSMDNYINQLNRNLGGVLSGSCKLSTQIPLKIYLSNQSIKLRHRTPFYLFRYLKQVNLQCFFFLWLYDTSCVGLGFRIFSLELDSNVGKKPIVSCPYTPPSYFRNVM